jgi:hypothetical protein
MCSYSMYIPMSVLIVLARVCLGRCMSLFLRALNNVTSSGLNLEIPYLVELLKLMRGARVEVLGHATDGFRGWRTFRVG